MKAGEPETSSLTGGEEALLGALVMLGLGTALGAPQGVPDLGKVLSLLGKVLVGQRLWAGAGGREAGPQMISEGLRGSWR